MTRFLPKTLRARLTLALVALMTAGLVVLGVATTAITSAAVSQMVDDQLTSSLASLERAVDRSHNPSSNRPPKPLVEFTSQASGTVIAVMIDGTVNDSAVFSDTPPAPLSPEAVAALEAEPWVPGERTDVDIPGLGQYRVTVADNEHGDRLIAAVSLADERASAAWATVAVVGIGLLTLIGMSIATIFIVRRATKPLERVVAAADTVSSLPLDRGAVMGIPRLNDIDTEDSSEAGRVVSAMNRMLQHVDEALATRAATDQRMRQFVTDASHELRTPLAAIQGYAELTRQESDVLPPLTESSLARIEAEAARMTMLVGDLLLLSRLDEGQGGLRSEPVDVCHLGLTAVNDARTVAPEWEWRTELPDEPVFVDGDHSAITQILANLLRNAHTHTPPGTAVTLRVHPAQRGVVELAVVDEGPGVEPDFRSSLFERFVRVDKSRSRRAGSTGLGLAIVAALVEAHGGSIRYADRAELDAQGRDDLTGAAFVVCLPAWNDSVDESPGEGDA